VPVSARQALSRHRSLKDPGVEESHPGEQRHQEDETCEVHVALHCDAHAVAERSLDEADMRRYSERTGGSYARAGDTNSLREIYDTVANLEKSRFERQRLLRYNELMLWALVPGLGLILLSVLLDATWLRRAP